MRKYRMRAAVIILLLTAFGQVLGQTAASAESEGTSDSGPLRLMTFNLRTANAADDQPWEKRRPAMKQLIEQEQPDLIGTQEGIQRQIKDLESDLPGYDWIGVGREGGSLGEYMAIFYNKTRLKPLEQDHFWLSDTPNHISSTGWGNRIPRMVSWVRFQDLHNRKTFYMVNTHLDHESEPARQRSAQLIIDRLKEFDPNVPVLLTGDFNTYPGGATYSAFIDGGLHDAFLDAHQRVNDTLGTFHNYKDPIGGGSSKRIDWILYRGKVNVIRGEIVTSTLDGQYPSDHYPVTVDFVLQKASKETGETVVKRPISTALQITEVVPNSNGKGNFNYVEIYNNSDHEIDLEGYKLYYYYDPALPFDKGKSNKWVITKDKYSTDSIIRPKETKVIWIKKQPCCYALDISDFRQNYQLTEQDLSADKLLAVFTPGENQGLNGVATTGRALGIVSPDGAHLVGIRYNNGVLDVNANESVIYSEPDALDSIMRKKAAHQTPTPGQAQP
ncbi:endonuclease/exonuclease/phosphatase family protein [Paenibacillus sp. NPDC056579]|uniref:endonuclease/exonuclease/phosphatase family protein n=1 Tax=Paenibacillus sp. NPDC056579 TaxID=3345871 RepID=UPI00368F382F